MPTGDVVCSIAPEAAPNTQLCVKLPLLTEGSDALITLICTSRTVAAGRWHLRQIGGSGASELPPVEQGGHPRSRLAGEC
jgi:hypothetical protein